MKSVLIDITGRWIIFYISDITAQMSALYVIFFNRKMCLAGESNSLDVSEMSRNFEK